MELWKTFENRLTYKFVSYMCVHSLFTCPQPKFHHPCLRFWSLIYFSAQGGIYILVLEELTFDQRIPTALSYLPLAMARCYPWFRR